MRIPIAQWVLEDWQGPSSNVKFRIVADGSFLARDNDNSGIEIDASDGVVFREVDCVVGSSVIDGITVKTITIPSLWLFSTDDAIVNRQATYSAYFITKSKRELLRPQFLQSFRIYADLINTSNPVNWYEIIRANNPAAPIPADKETYSVQQILDLIGTINGPTVGPNALANRVAYFTSPTALDGASGLVFDNVTGRLDIGRTGLKGSARFINANNAFIQSIESADTPASTIRFQLPASDPSVGNSLRVSSFAGGVAVLEWSNPPGGGGGGGSGDVTGPNSSTDNALARFDQATGKVIQNSTVTLGDTGILSGATFGTGNILGAPTMTLGGDGTGDIYYRAAGGALTRLGIGSNTQVLTVSGGLPSWQNAPGGGGSGDVVGPGSATDNAIARFDLATGKLIQNSTVIVADNGNVTGLGTLNTHTLPGGTDTIALLAAAQSLTNKTIGATNIIGGVTMTLGSDGTGDVYYRAAGGALTRLAIGAPGNVLTVSGGNLPSWAAPSAGTGDVVGPAGATDNAIARFDTTTGKLIQNSAVTIADTTGAFTVPAAWSLNDNNGNEIFTISPQASAINQLTFGNSATGNPVSIAFTGGDTDGNIQLAPKGAGVVESTGPLTLSGTGTVSFITPTAVAVPTKINIPLFTPPGFAQVMAMGLASGAPSTARVICVFDQRGAGHQPSIALQAPDEQNIFGMTWDGQNSVGFISSTTNLVGFLGTDAYFGNAQVSATPASMVLNATGGSGTNIAGASLHLAGGKGTGTAQPGFVAVRYPIVTTTGTTLQALSTSSFPVVTSMYNNLTDGTAVASTTAETSLLTGVTAGPGSTLSIQANSTYSGTKYRIRVTGIFTTTASPTLQIRVKVGTFVVGDSGAQTITMTQGAFEVIGEIGPSAAPGASTATRLQGGRLAIFNTVSPASPGFYNCETIASVNFTANQTIDVTAQWGTSNASNSITLRNITIERIR